MTRRRPPSGRTRLAGVLQPAERLELLLGLVHPAELPIGLGQQEDDLGVLAVEARGGLEVRRRLPGVALREQDLSQELAGADEAGLGGDERAQQGERLRGPAGEVAGSRRGG